MTRDEELADEALPARSSIAAHYCLPVVVEPFSDPRLQGTYFIWPYHDEHTDGPTTWAQGFTITNDEGAWRGIPVVSLDSSPGETHVLIGDGAYTGLTAVATVSWPDTGSGWDWHGWIIQGDVPPMPAPSGGGRLTPRATAAPGARQMPGGVAQGVPPRRQRVKRQPG